jgi:hypothetical protein
MYSVKRKRIDVHIVNELFSRIQSTVETLRRNQKFNGYRFKSYPQLIRGSETDEIPFKNQLFPITQDTNSEFEYKFTFFLFLQTPLETEKNHCEVDLEVRINPNVDFPSLTIGLELRISPSQTEYYSFDWEDFFHYGKSIDDILYDFEHSFLEVPPILLSLKGSPPVVAMNCMRKRLFEQCYEILRDHNLDIIEKRLTAAMMFSHYNKSFDLFSVINNMSDDSKSKDFIMEQPWPNFKNTIEHELRRFREREIDEHMDYEDIIKKSFERGNSMVSKAWS